LCFSLGLELKLGLGLELGLELRLGLELGLELRLGLELAELRLNTFSVKRTFGVVSSCFKKHNKG